MAVASAAVFLPSVRAADDLTDTNVYRKGTNTIAALRAIEVSPGVHAPTFVLVDENGDPVGLTAAQPAGENHIGEVGGRTAVPSANFTRPSDTTAYASGDLVANSTTAGSVAPLSWTAARVAAGSGMIRRARIKTSSTNVTNASFRLHLYKASPTPSNGDNGAWLTNQSANYLGSLDITVDRAFTDGATGNGTPNIGTEINFALSSGQTIYGLLEARGAYTPTSAGTFTVELEILQN